MAKSTPKGFIELHFAKSGRPVLIKVDMISFLNPVYEDKSGSYYGESKKVNWTDILPLGHNNGGFCVRESYEEVCKKMVEVLEEN